MNYVYNYALGSILFGSLTLIFFFREKHIRDFQDRMYTLLLISAYVAVVFDALAAMLEPIAFSLPRWIPYASNMIFLLAMQSCLPCFWQYSLFAVGKLRNYSYRARTLFCLPYFAVLLCLLISPFCRFGIFYLDELNVYRYGAMHFLLYVSSCFYMLISTGALLRNFKTVQKEKRIVILIFSALVFLSMLLQILFPRYLLTSSACMLAVSAVFYILQSPLEMRDPFTGACNRMLLPSILQSYHQQSASYTLLLFSQHTFDQICSVYGAETGDEVLRRLAESLQKDFPNDLVIYMDTAEFTVLCTRIISREELESINAARPRYIMTSGGRIPMELNIAAVLHDGTESCEVVLNSMDYLYHKLRTQQNSELMIADASFQLECAKQLQLEANIEDILKNGKPVLAFEPILRWGRVPCGAGTKLTVEHPAAGGIDFMRLFRACEQGGFAWRQLTLTLESASPYRDQFSADCRLFVPLSLFLFTNQDSLGRILDITRSSGFEPRQIGFYALESSVASSSSATLENLNQLAELGFAFCLDDFAEGYSDIALLTSLPLFAVRLSPGMLSLAANDMRQLKLLRGAVDILHTLGVMAICGGIDSTDDASVAAAVNITMLQGDFVYGAANFPKEE